MVRERKYTPVVVITIPALVAVYVLEWLIPSVNGCLQCICVLLLFFSLLSSVYTVFPSRRVLFINYILVGLLTGIIVFLGISIRDHPVHSMANREKITSISATLLSDPKPFGIDYYRVPVRTHSVHTGPETSFSANGIAELIFPASHIRQSFPGSISCSKTRFIPVAGSTVNYPVKTVSEQNEGRTRFHFDSKRSDSVRVQEISHVSRYRNRLRYSLIQLLYDWKEPGGLLLALLSANRDYIEPVLSVSFRDAGLSHILALSGMHLAIAGSIAFGLGFMLGGRKIAVVLSLAIMVCFVWFAGTSPSLSRALLMALCATLMRSLGVRVHPVPIILLSLMIQLLVAGEDSLSLAFMLSYTALLGIVLPGTWLIRLLEPVVPAPVSSALCASIGAQLCTAPIIAFTFGMLSPVGILAACIITPLISIYLVAGIGLIALSAFFSGISDILIPAYTQFYRFIRQLVMFFASCPKIVLQGLSGAVTASILSILVTFVLYYLYRLTCTRRAPHALFA